MQSTPSKTAAAAKPSYQTQNASNSVNFTDVCLKLGVVIVVSFETYSVHWVLTDCVRSVFKTLPTNSTIFNK